MYRVNEIKAALLHLVGWQQNYDTSEFTIADSLTQSDTGLYFQQAHPLLTLQNLRSIAPNFDSPKPDVIKNEYPTYSITNLYKANDRCSYNGKTYRATSETLGDSPDGGSPWEEHDYFSEWLEDKTVGSILKAVSEYVNRKMSTGGANKLLESKCLFDGAGRLVDTIANQKALAGFEIVPVRGRGVTTKINRIGLQFTKAGAITLYLFHSSSSAPIKTIELTITKPNTMQWFTVADLYLPYVSDTNDAGGSWYLMYNQSELAEDMKAISKDRDWSKEPCSGCSALEYSNWQAWSRYLEVHPFKVSNFVEDDILGLQLWDIQNNLYTLTTNYGLNLEVTVECDITDYIIAQKGIFKDIIQYQVAVDFLREMAYNPNVRINRNALNITKADILYELDGDSTSLKKSGLAYKLDLAHNAIAFNTRGIDRICLPCKTGGIKYRTV